jgi:hypothetical protein
MTMSGRLLLAGLLVACGVVQAAPTPTHAATCVAALKTRAEPLVQRVRRGDAAAEAQLLPIVTATFAFVGTVYKQGVRGPQADELLRQAEQAQAKVPPAELTRTQDACHAEAQQMLAQASFFERQFVAHAAKSRVDRLRPAS